MHRLINAEWLSSVTAAVIQYASIDLQSGIQGHKPELYADNVLFVIMAVGIGMKLVLWIFCARINKTLQSDTIGIKRIASVFFRGWMNGCTH